MYEYPKENLKFYSLLVMIELYSRGIKYNTERFKNYFGYVDGISPVEESEKVQKLIMERPFPTNPFPNHHTDRYLIQCFCNLQEKYDRGQKDFSEREYNELERFFKGKLEPKR